MLLRPYQQQGIADIREAFRQHRRVLYVLPTGGGKTAMFCYLAIQHIRKNPNGLVYIIVHRIELVRQIEEELRSQSYRPGLLTASAVPLASDRIVVASVGTLVRRISKFVAPSFLIVDEAHHSIATSQWGKVGSVYNQARILGVTATPVRLSGEGLGSCFDIMVCGPTTQHLISAGFLVKPIVYCPAVPDLSQAHSRGGEYISAELEEILDKSTITGDAIEAYKKYADGKRFVCFGVSRAHIEKVAGAFLMAGIDVAAIDGRLDAVSRKNAIGDFRNGKITGLISCQLIDEGFDVPGIECGIDLAPTKSKGRYLQRVGRCLRIADGKTEAIILDLAGNALRHNLPDAEQKWNLEGTYKTKIRQSGEKPPSVRICPDCFAANISSFDVCRQCGITFPINGRTFLAQKGELEILSEKKAAEIAAQKAEAERQRKLQSQSKGYDDLVQLARQRGYRRPEQWAWIIHRARQAKRQKMRARI